MHTIDRHEESIFEVSAMIDARNAQIAELKL